MVDEGRDQVVKELPCVVNALLGFVRGFGVHAVGQQNGDQLTLRVDTDLRAGVACEGANAD